MDADYNAFEIYCFIKYIILSGLLFDQQTHLNLIWTRAAQAHVQRPQMLKWALILFRDVPAAKALEPSLASNQFVPSLPIQSLWSQACCKDNWSMKIATFTKHFSFWLWRIFLWSWHRYSFNVILYKTPRKCDSSCSCCSEMIENINI